MNKLLTGLRPLVAMQLRDKIDVNAAKNKKQFLRILFINLLKFLVVTGCAFLVFYLCVTFIFTTDETPKVLILVLSISLLLSLITCTSELMKTLYFAEDNRVLITFPVEPNKIFISKIIVYYLYELKKSLFFLVPIILSGVILLCMKGLCSPLAVVWMIIPLLFVLMLPVLIGALLSIPAMYVYRFLKQRSTIQVLLFFACLVGGIACIVYLINLIPTNIDLINQWPIIKESVRTFLIGVEKNLVVISQLLYMIIGDKTQNLSYVISLMSIVKIIVLILTCVVLAVLVYFLSRPLFFNMMSKNFEINKSTKGNKPNKRKNKYFTFLSKEFVVNLRTINISVNYLMVYVVVPIMILFLNVMYEAMDTRTLGDLLIYSFNILLILLPMLASNALVATYYSREGRAGYLKKTKPIYALYPLMTKIFFNALLSIPSLCASVCVFGKYVDFNGIQILLLILTMLTLHYGHMIYSATLDVMNPQNEQYATTGINVDNPNENKSTMWAFIISFIFALISYKLLSESVLGSATQNITFGIVKLLMLGIAYFASMVLMFVKRIKAFYYEIQG